MLSVKAAVKVLISPDDMQEAGVLQIGLRRRLHLAFTRASDA